MSLLVRDLDYSHRGGAIWMIIFYPHVARLFA